jgi:hypothetical protein
LVSKAQLIEENKNHSEVSEPHLCDRFREKRAKSRAFCSQRYFANLSGQIDSSPIFASSLQKYFLDDN